MSPPHILSNLKLPIILQMDPTYPLIPIVNFLACILVLASMSKGMFQSWNVGACSFAIWVTTISFTTAVDSILWADNVENLAPVWCDISEFSDYVVVHTNDVIVSRLQVGSNTGISVASLVIIQRLSAIIHLRDPIPDNKRV